MRSRIKLNFKTGKVAVKEYHQLKKYSTTSAVYRDFRVTIGCSPMVELFPCWTLKQADAALNQNGWDTVKKWRKTYLGDALISMVRRHNPKPSTFLRWNKDGGYTRMVVRPAIKQEKV